MSFIFALCDKDADGQLELWELSDLISDASDDMNELGDHIKARIPTFDDGGGFVEMVEFEALLKSDAHLYLNFYWTWVPFIGGNLLAGLELFEQVAIAVGVLPNFELALRMCPAFSAAAGLATAGDWKIGALELAQVLFGALGVPVPAGESFRAPQPSEGDGVPAKDDGATPRAAERVGAADGAETPSMAPTKSKDMHFFATPVLTGAQTAPLMFKLSKAVTLVFDELLGAYKRRAAHAAKANPKPGEVDQFGAPLLPIENKAAPPPGLKQVLEQGGPAAFAKAVREAKGLLLTDTTWRDAHQSLLATRVRTLDLVRGARVASALLPDAFSFECWGGATFDVSYRFLKEDPWDRLRALRAAAPNVCTQMLIRGANAVGYTSYPDTVSYTHLTLPTKA